MIRSSSQPESLQIENKVWFENDKTHATITLQEKIEIYQQFPLIFRKREIYHNLVVPILMSKKAASEKMEHLYDRQFELILRRKTMDSLNISLISIESYENIYHSSSIQIFQHLSNFVYSVKRYAPINPEFSFFIEFLQNDQNQERLLFYLYVRQFFKILTYTTFLAHRKTNKNPNDIQITTVESNHILKLAFGHHQLVLKQLSDEVNSGFKKSKQISYYQFLTIFMNSKIVYNELDLLKKSIGLYSVDYNEELRKNLKVKTARSVTPIKKPQEIQVNGKEKLFVQTEVKVEAANMSSYDVQTKSYVLDKKIQNTQEGMINQSKIITKNRIPEAIMSVSLKPIKNQELKPFYTMTKSEVFVFAQQVLDELLLKYPQNHKTIKEMSQMLGLLIQNKLHGLIDAIFQEDSQKLHKLLREKPDENPQIIEYFEEVKKFLNKNEILHLSEKTHAKDFLAKVYFVSQIDAKIDFLVTFHIKEETLHAKLKEREQNKLLKA